MGAVVVLLQVVNIVGTHQGQPKVPGYRLQPGVDGALYVNALILHLEKEVARSKNVPERGRRLGRFSGLLGA